MRLRCVSVNKSRHAQTRPHSRTWGMLSSSGAHMRSGGMAGSDGCSLYPPCASSALSVRGQLLAQCLVIEPFAVTSGLISFCAARVVQDPGAGDFTNPPFCKNAQLSSYVTTLATTAVATLMICYKTWYGSILY